jgi:penicillin-binding protein 1A
VIDMTRAFAAVSAKGRAVEPYGITKVVTTDGAVLYTRPVKQGALLVPGYVSAGMTDLLQSAVAIGTGRSAQIGRPVAGKTGTTTSNKDGWFLGFSSGITTGVWMGRDDAKPVAGLSGGHAPAQAFAAFMRLAVAGRPVEQFETDVKVPAWQIEPDDQASYASPEDYYYTDEQGNFVKPEVQSGSLPPERVPAEEPAGPDQGGLVPVNTKPAANDDFLREATGEEIKKEKSAGRP